MSDIEMGKAFVANVEETIQKGLIWKRLTEESGKLLEEAKAEVKSEEKVKLSELKRRRTEEKKRKLELERTLEAEDPQPTPLTQEVYSEGVRNWAAQTSFKRFFGTGDVRENCTEITTNSISANLDSDGCREDPSLHGGKGKHLMEISERTTPDEVSAPKSFSNCEKPKLLGNFYTNSQLARGYHTMYEEHLEEKRLERKLKRQELKRSFAENRESMLMPIQPNKQTTDLVVKRVAKKSQTSRERRMEWKQNKFREKPHKILNASAKQKYRSFNSQKKFTPSAAVTLHIDQQRKEKASRNLELVLAEAKKKQEETQKKEETYVDEKEEEEVKEEAEKKELIIQREKDRYREFILQRLQELKRENEELKKRLSKLVEDKRLETILQNQSDNLELEKTKLKACWLIMSSTMDAFSNFCKRFTLKTDNQFLEAMKELEKKQEEEKQEKQENQEKQEDFEDASEEQTEEGKTSKGKNKKEKYDEKYFNFLQKLMEDQMENEMDNEKKRNRVRK